MNEATFCTPELEMLSVKLSMENHVDIIVVSLYRPPTGTVSAALDKIMDVCESLCAAKSKRDIYLVGDLNLNLLVNNSSTKLFSEICGQYSFYSLINIPTRIVKNATTAIDIIVTNCNMIDSSGVIEYNVSDHLLLYSVKKHVKVKDIKVKSKVRTFRNYDLELIKVSLAPYNWGRFYASFNVDDAWDELYRQILINANFFAPFVESFVRSNQPGWLTNSIIENSIERDRLLALAKKSDDESLRKKARDKRNEVKTSIKNARSDFYIDKLKRYSGDPKKYWNKINELMKGNSS